MDMSILNDAVSNLWEVTFKSLLGVTTISEATIYDLIPNSHALS